MFSAQAHHVFCCAVLSICNIAFVESLKLQATMEETQHFTIVNQQLSTAVCVVGHMRTAYSSKLVEHLQAQVAHLDADVF
jgi:hypothetical protein